MRRVAPLVALLAVLPACGKKGSSDPNGVGPWQFGKTKLADAEAAGRCLPAGSGGTVMCVGLSAIQIGAQPAQTDLYFKSADKNAPLLEISLTVRACDVENAGAALDKVLGPAKETSPDGRIRSWTYETMFVVAQLPAKGSMECLVNFVDPKDTQRIADLKAGK
jgi:predicted small lipoprotein YifL